jgi:branched-chain amino acid aminotransferase
MTGSSHAFEADPRNAGLLVYVNGRHVPRDQATVSVFDSGFMLGDGVWEGIRLHNGVFAFLDRHLDRLYEGAKTLDLDIGMGREAMTEALHELARANGVDSGAHVRLMVTRGPKARPFQDPRLSVSGPTVVIILEYNAPAPESAGKGIRLFTAHIHRGAPDTQDARLNSHSKLNCILAMIQAIHAGADEALMLDADGFVATCNSTNFFIVRRGEVLTSPGEYCLNGITRENVLRICAEQGIPAREQRFSLVDTYAADEAFVTGTVGGLTPVASVDGRMIGAGTPGPMTARLTQAYRALVELECSAVGRP